VASSTARILVTGAGGFVARHLIERIVAHGGAALGVGVDRAPAATAALLAGEWTADVCDAGALAAMLREAAPTAIVHLAAQSSAGVSFDQPLETYRINALGTYALLEAVRAAAPAVRVLVVGTGEVYGPQPAGSRIGEDTPIRPVSPYALSKAAADAIAEHAGSRGLDVVRTRSFAHIGPGQTDRFVLPSIARQIAEGEKAQEEAVVRVGNLEVTRDMTDVRDVADAYLALLERGRSGAVYNVCRGAGVRLVDLARSLGDLARIPVRFEVDATRLRAADVPYLVGDPAAILRDTGWKAARPLERALEDVLEEWRDRRSSA
jgi:GDP-4-dehydro-6-deoxy-D-mannose reductase